MTSPKYIAIDGPIGVGKTSLAHKLAEGFGGRLILEEAEKNPFLEEFYQNRRKNALKTQIFFLLSRYQQQRDLGQHELFSKITISDYLFSRDNIFASINLVGEELLLYEKIYSLFDARIPKPDLAIYLQSTPDALIKNIRKRKTRYEKDIDYDYLEALCESYNRFFFNYRETPLLIINCTEIDFMKYEDHYLQIVNQITSKKRGTQHYIAIGK